MAEKTGRDQASAQRFNEILVIMDDQSWIWNLASSHLSLLGKAHVRLPSTVPVRQSWERLRNAARIVIHWEAKDRSGGAIIEEILDVQPSFDVADRVVVLTTNPTHEDVVYFSELNVRRIIRLRNRDKDLAGAGREFDLHVTAEASRDSLEQAWRRVLYVLDTLPADATPETLARIEEAVQKLKPAEPTARYLDAVAKLAAGRGDDVAAMKYWHMALDKNPNYYRAYTNLIAQHQRRSRLPEALGLMQKMHELNKQNISRLVTMGEIQMQLRDHARAEFYFKSAVDRDSYCSGALNGLAEIRFHQGDLEESRRLLSKSQLAYKTATTLNAIGIEMVKLNRYEDALEHYTRAQYVLPQQDKGPLLFYNIGLCYSRWGRHAMAREFLKIALIKEPNYKKAKKLLALIEGKLGSVEYEVA